MIPSTWRIVKLNFPLGIGCISIGSRGTWIKSLGLKFSYALIVPSIQCFLTVAGSDSMGHNSLVCDPNSMIQESNGKSFTGFRIAI